MNNYPFILIDTGIIVAFYDVKDYYHQQVLNFFNTYNSQLITTLACVTFSKTEVISAHLFHCV